MAVALLVAGVLGGALLLAAAVLLCILNYSEKLWGPIVSILLGGTVTAIIAVASGLKETRTEQGFATAVVFDHGLAAFLPFDLNAPKISHRLSNLASLGRPATQQKDGTTALTIKPAESDDELFQYGSELLQYQVVRELASIQRGGWSVQHTQGAVQQAVRIPVPVSRVADVSGEEVLRRVRDNRFANSDIERFLWQHGRLPLPEGTTIQLVHMPTSQQTGPEKRIVRLVKPWFFVIDIVIEPIGGSGPRMVPAGLSVPAETRAALRTFSYKMIYRAKFELLTSGNWQTEEHKRWAEWLFVEIRDAMTD